MNPLASLFRRYRTALREEPKLRWYLAASLVDDIGIAASGWASMLILTHLFTDQRERARLAIPSLCCVLAGSVVSGPLADWAETSLARLAAFRYRLVVWARVVETVTLAGLVVLISRAPPSIGSILPYVMVSAFLKTALRPARAAFQVDLLRVESPQVAPDGSPLLDERGQSRSYKTHLLSFGALTGTLQALAALVGLVLGGQIMALAGQRYWPLFAVDVLTNLGFIAILAAGRHPAKAARAVRLADLFGERGVARASRSSPVRAPVRAIHRVLGRVLGHFGASVRGGVRFLAAREQRPLLALLAGCWIVEVVAETYDGKMIVKQILHGSDETVRLAVLAYTVLSAVGMVLLPLLAGRVRSLGRIFLVAMFADGLCMALAGRIAGRGEAAAIRPFVLALSADQALTKVSGSLADLAQNSASSAAMRGRIAAVFGFSVLLGQMGAEVVATRLAESMGIPAMLVRMGFVQVGLMVLIALAFGKPLWNFGLRVAQEHARPDAGPDARDVAAAPQPEGVIASSP